MKLNSWILTSTAVCAALNLVSAGDITGKISLKGMPPAEKDIDHSKDPNCGQTIKTPLKTRFYVTDGSGGLGDVVVFIKSGLEGKKFPAPEKPALIDQTGCEYTPYVSAIQTDQKLLVRNSDKTFHNVHPTPQVPGNKEDNKAQLAGAPDLTFTYPAQEIPLKFSCNVHPWMIAYVAVVSHPFFAVSAKDGSFTIKGVPPGKYTVEAFHRKSHGPAGKGVTQEVTVGADGAKANFTVEVPQ